MLGWDTVPVVERLTAISHCGGEITLEYDKTAVGLPVEPDHRLAKTLPVAFSKDGLLAYIGKSGEKSEAIYI